jgi:hypothetical protein
MERSIQYPNHTDLHLRVNITAVGAHVEVKHRQKPRLSHLLTFLRVEEKSQVPNLLVELLTPLPETFH